MGWPLHSITYRAKGQAFQVNKLTIEWFRTLRKPVLQLVVEVRRTFFWSENGLDISSLVKSNAKLLVKWVAKLKGRS